MLFPKIAIIGRPNVGKSALFNRLLKKRIAIVDEMEGVTRDRLYAEGEFEGNPFILTDTAGIETTDHSELNLDLLNQTLLALKEADICIFVLDAKVGITKMDEQIAKRIRQHKKFCVVALNKVDHDNQRGGLDLFYSLGFEEMIDVSAEHGRNIYELLEKVFHKIPSECNEFPLGEAPHRISLVGRTNVGKSTLMNALLQEPRCVVSPVAGTTRDAIEVTYKKDDISYIFIDTAGVRRKNKEKEVVEKFAHIRTLEAIERSDLCLFLVDAKEGLTSQEKKMLSEIYRMGKSCIIALNKWDLIKGFRMEHVKQALIQDCPFVSIYPVIFISALTQRNLDKIFVSIEKICDFRKRKIETPLLNKFIEQAFIKTPPPMIKGKRLKVYYITQVKSNPPTFLMFVNRAGLFSHTYKRYILNQMRNEFDFEGTPIQFLLKSKNHPKVSKKRLKPLCETGA